MAELSSIGKYEIRREIGRGAMGVVYEGYDPSIKRVVALKTIRIKPGQLTSLPLQHPEQLLLVPAATEHRSRTVRGLHLRSQVEISQRGRVDEMDLGIPRILVDQLNRHDDPLTCAPGRTGPAGLGSPAASTIAPVRGPAGHQPAGDRYSCRRGPGTYGSDGGYSHPAMFG